MNLLKSMTLFCVRLMPNLVMATSAIVLFALLAVTICISILFEEWQAERAQKDETPAWAGWHTRMLPGKSDLPVSNH